MSFWGNFREDVLNRTTTSDVSQDLFNSIIVAGVPAVAVVQPTFYLGRFYILSFDFVSFVEQLLKCKDNLDDVFRNILYIRETVNTMGRAIRNAAEPIEGMMTFLDPIYEEQLIEEGEDDRLCCSSGCEDSSCDCGEAAVEEFAHECSALSVELRELFLSVNISEKVALELSTRLAGIYSGCVSYVQALRYLHASNAEEDFSGFMVSLIDIQYLLDTRLRGLLLEDVFTDERPSFSTGITPWLSHAIEELATMAGYGEKSKHASNCSCHHHHSEEAAVQTEAAINN